MANYRRGRINDEMQKELAMILREVKDPRVKDAFISITAVEATGDLKFAKIFYSVLGDDKDEVLKALKSAAGFFRSELAKRINLRITPQLTFAYDSSMEYGANISSILKTLDIKPLEDEENDDEA